MNQAMNFQKKRSHLVDPDFFFLKHHRLLYTIISSHIMALLVKMHLVILCLVLLSSKFITCIFGF